MAPATFGQFGGALLVANFGGGFINAFDPATGNQLGTLQDNTGHNIPLPGLWALYFGNGGKGGDPATLYFTAAIAGPLPRRRKTVANTCYGYFPSTVMMKAARNVATHQSEG